MAREPGRVLGIGERSVNRGRFQITTRQLLFLVVASSVGLALSPADLAYLAALTPAAVIFRWLAPGPAITIGIFGLIPLVFTELLLAFPVSASLYVPVAIALAPPWLLLPSPPPGEGTDGKAAVAAGEPPPRRRSRLRRYLAVTAVYALIGALYFVPWSTRKPFLRALFSIRPGMTAAEARRRMAGYMEGTGWTDPSTNQELTIDQSIVFRHSDRPEFNSDWGIVTIRDGKVVDVDFSPD